MTPHTSSAASTARCAVDETGPATADGPQSTENRGRPPSRGLGMLATALRGLGELCVTFGVVALLFVGYELWFTGLAEHRAQAGLHRQLGSLWGSISPDLTPGSPSVAVAPDDQLPTPALGAGLAILRIPRLGSSYDPVIVEGVTALALEKGPGHYPGTALPGQVGNFVVSGHRTTYGAPFNRLDEVKPGDAIVVETRTRWYTYDVSLTQLVDPTDVAVTDPVPDHPGVAPTARMLTFITCNPEYSAAQRLVVHAKLAASDLRSAGIPAALAAG